ncbi:hypothetical protein F2P79_000580 [Pimephales promelas]|nr:hypothetical protein F2P79_000580 [Pimephales promelas]
MFSVLVLLTAVVCCNACHVEYNPPDTTNSPGCTDSEGNLHEFYSEWSNEHDTCVCVDFGIICCGRFDHHFQTETTSEIFYDNFGAFTDNDIGGNEEPSQGSGDEE